MGAAYRANTGACVPGKCCRVSIGRSGIKQVQDKYRANAGQVQDKYRAGAGQVQTQCVLYYNKIRFVKTLFDKIRGVCHENL